jgi:hypothetical protein
MSILLKDVPKDVKSIILQLQSDAKIKKNIGKYSQEKVIYQALRDYWGLIKTLEQCVDSKRVS